MFAAIPPRTKTIPRSQQNRLLREAEPSSWFCTDVTCVVGTAATQISGKSPVPADLGQRLFPCQLRP